MKKAQLPRETIAAAPSARCAYFLHGNRPPADSPKPPAKSSAADLLSIYPPIGEGNAMS